MSLPGRLSRHRTKQEFLDLVDLAVGNQLSN